MSLSTTHSLAYPRVTTVGDFLALLKPRVMSHVVFTGLAGIVAAPGPARSPFTALPASQWRRAHLGCPNGL
jgi:heme O synthase-like polyprenyltransferase